MAEKTGKGKGNTVQTVEALVAPLIDSMGLRLWDVRFEKEGPDWFLRIFLDRDAPLDIDTCEAAARAINPLMDEADPIEQSYYLEVGSPGLGRRLTKDAHFAAKQGEVVCAHLYRATEAGEKELTGILVGKEGEAVTLRMEADNTERTVCLKDAAYFKLCDDLDLF